MSNLNNMYISCPAIMSDGRVSVNTDYRPKNDAFKASIAGSSNSFVFRDNLQKKGYTNMTEANKFNLCSVVPYGDVLYNKEIKLDYSTIGSWSDAFQTMKGSPLSVPKPQSA